MKSEQQYHFWFSAKEKEILRSKAIENGEDFSIGLFRKSEFTQIRYSNAKPKGFDDYQYIGYGHLDDVENG